MTLIFGGAYQGKLDWALGRGTAPGEAAIIAPHSPAAETQCRPGPSLTPGITPAPRTVYCCRADCPDLDLSAEVINGLHLYILALIRAGKDPVAEVSALLPRLEDKILICDDLTGGVVPLEAEARAHREAVGRVMSLLAARADRVVRVFCGIGLQLKP